MKETAPTLREWKELYQAAREFKELACWEWMLDSDNFGVQDSEIREVGYCCILGHLGEVFALAVYLGSEGLDGYLKTATGVFAPQSSHDILHLQRCLMASFEDRSSLQKKDLATINRLRLRFRGKSAWPLFRSYRPGHQPWHLTRAEALFLTLVLRQTMDVALRCRENPALLKPPKEGYYLVRVPANEEKGFSWKDTWYKPEPYKEPPPPSPHIDEIRLKRIKRGIATQQGTWEVDYFYGPMVIQEAPDERPFYPLVFLIVDSQAEYVLSVHLADRESCAEEFQEHFIDLAEGVNTLPKKLLVARREAHALFQPVCAKLGIGIEIVPSLSALEDARHGMFDFFGPRRRKKKKGPQRQ
jgi:hypothetical protein